MTLVDLTAPGTNRGYILYGRFSADTTVFHGYENLRRRTYIYQFNGRFKMKEYTIDVR